MFRSHIHSVVLFSAHGVHLAVMDIMYRKPAYIVAEDTHGQEDRIELEGEGEAEDEELQMTESFRLEEFPTDVVLPDLSDS